LARGRWPEGLRGRLDWPPHALQQHREGATIPPPAHRGSGLVGVASFQLDRLALEASRPKVQTRAFSNRVAHRPATRFALGIASHCGDIGIEAHRESRALPSTEASGDHAAR